MATSVFEVSGNGMRITMTDGTIWEPVTDGEMTKATHLHAASPIDMSKLPNGEFIVINHESHDEKIRVRQVDDGGDSLLYA